MAALFWWDKKGPFENVAPAVSEEKCVPQDRIVAFLHPSNEKGCSRNAAKDATILIARHHSQR